MRFTLKSLLVVVLILSASLAITRARFFPPAVRVHLVEPGQYKIDGVVFNAADLKTHLVKRVNEIQSTIYYPRVLVILPVDRNHPKFDDEYHKLTTIGCGAGFDSVEWAKHPDEPPRSPRNSDANL